MGSSSIEWTQETWNPVVGCSKRSTGCLNCYAEQVHKLRHNGRNGYPIWLPWTARNAEHNVTLLPDRLGVPLRWRKPRIVFVCSMSDLFHEQVPFEYIDRVFTTMARCPESTFQVLTKRPERMREYVLSREGISEDPLPNVWLGTSIENRKWISRADDLRATPADTRFLSCEPLVGPLVEDVRYVPELGDYGTVHGGEFEWTGLNLDGIDWLIVGGESGPQHRPLDLQWVRDLRDACSTSGTAFFVKQTGGHRPGTKLEDLPADLRIRELPAAATLALTP